MLKLADTSLILINPSPSNVKEISRNLSRFLFYVSDSRNIYHSKVHIVILEISRQNTLNSFGGKFKTGVLLILAMAAPADFMNLGLNRGDLLVNRPSD